MFKNLKIKSVKDIETFLWVLYKYLPYPKGLLRKKVAQIFPYLVALAGSYLLTIAFLPLLFSDFPYDPLYNSGLFDFNIILSRILFFIMGLAAILSVEKLIAREKQGYYNVFYLILFHAFFVLVVFNAISSLLLLIELYLLFAVKPEFKS